MDHLLHPDRFARRAVQFFRRSQDNKGNVEIARELAVRIDTKPPVITITSPAAGSISQAQKPKLVYSVTDGPATGVGAGSGVSSVTVTMDGVRTEAASGQILNLQAMPLGAHTVQIIAVDKAGHSASQFVTFTVTK